VTSRRLAALAIGFGVMLVTIAGCGGGDDDDAGTDLSAPRAADGFRIASFNFVESVLLAEMYAQVVESVGVPVVRLGEVGPREITMPALQNDLIDLVPEYLGTALDRAGSPAPVPDTDAALAELVDRLTPLGLTALDAAPAEDKNAVVVTADTARAEGLATISDLGPIASTLRFGGPPECPDRPLCLVGLADTYGLEFAEFVSQGSQSFTAESLRRGEIDVGLMFSTNPSLASADFVVLDDDRHLQPAENVVPVVRTDALDRWGPAVAMALDAMSAELTTSTLQILNARVETGRTIERVANDWLESRGLGPPTEGG
jgi:osmoprotectant transport system substrate-binding protein